MNPRLRSARNAALLLAALPLSGCAGLGTLGDLLGGLPGGDVSGEIRRVDERRREIEVRTPYGGSQRVEYDRNTRVLYRQERYSVRALEAGDRVTMQVQRDPRGGLYTDRIRVDRSVRDRRDSRYPGDVRDRDRDRDRDGDWSESRARSFQGRVGRIDRRRGWFELVEESRASVVVSLPGRPGRETVDRFRRLRSGDRVRLEGWLLERDRVELRRFR